MAKILNVMSSIRVSELVSLVSALERSFKAKEISRKIVNDTMNEIITLNGAIVARNGKEKVSMSLAAADKARDAEIKLLSKILDGYASMKNADLRDTAMILKKELDSYLKNKLISRNQEEESGLIITLLKTFSTPRFTAAIEKLPGVADAISAVSAAQDDYIRSRDAIAAAKQDKDLSASDMKREIVRKINDVLIPFLNTALLEDDEDLRDFAKSAAVEISSVNNLISTRSKAKKKASAKALGDAAADEASEAEKK